MAVLTWKNVDAPDMGQAGTLLSGAGESFSRAMQGLSQAAEGHRTRQMDQRSSQALLGLAGLGSADEFQSFVQGLDPEGVNADAMDVILKMPERFLDREASQAQIELRRAELANTQGDTAHEAWTRGNEQTQYAGQQTANPILAQANYLASIGKINEARELIKGLGSDPTTAGFVGSAMDGLNQAYRTHHELSDADHNRQRSRAKEERDLKTSVLTTDAFKNYASKEEALASGLLMEGLDPETHSAYMQSLQAADPSMWSTIDPNAEQVELLGGFGGISDEGMPIFNDADSRMEQLEYNNNLQATLIDQDLNSMDTYRYNKHLENLTSDTNPDGSGYVDPATYLRDTVGFVDGHVVTIDESLAQVEKYAKEAGVTIDKRQAAAAIAETHGLGFWDSNNKTASERDAAKLAIRMVSDKSIKEDTAKIQVLERQRQALSEKTAELETLRANATNLAAKGSEKAPAAIERYRKAAADLERQQASWMSKREAAKVPEPDGEPEPDSPEAAVAGFLGSTKQDYPEGIVSDPTTRGPGISPAGLFNIDPSSSSAGNPAARNRAMRQAQNPGVDRTAPSINEAMNPYAGRPVDEAVAAQIIATQAQRAEAERSRGARNDQNNQGIADAMLTVNAQRQAGAEEGARGIQAAQALKQEQATMAKLQPIAARILELPPERRESAIRSARLSPEEAALIRQWVIQ